MRFQRPRPTVLLFECSRRPTTCSAWCCPSPTCSCTPTRTGRRRHCGPRRRRRPAHVAGDLGRGGVDSVRGCLGVPLGYVLAASRLPRPRRCPDRPRLPAIVAAARPGGGFLLFQDLRSISAIEQRCATGHLASADNRGGPVESWPGSCRTHRRSSRVRSPPPTSIQGWRWPPPPSAILRRTSSGASRFLSPRPQRQRASPCGGPGPGKLGRRSSRSPATRTPLPSTFRPASQSTGLPGALPVAFLLVRHRLGAVGPVWMPVDRLAAAPAGR